VLGALVANMRLAQKLFLAIILTLVFLPLQLIALQFKLNLRSTLPVKWHRMMCRIIGIRVVLHGQASIARPLLIVANHVSWSDISVLSTVMPLSFVAKSEVKDWPLFGSLAKLQRTVFINREIRHQTGLQAKAIAARLGHEKDVMVLFAEGTTGDGTRLLPFKSALTGAAALAIGDDGIAHVQPVAIAYTRYGGLPVGFKRRLQAAWIGDLELVPHLKQILSGQPLDVEVSFGDPIIIEPPVNRKAVTEACQQSIGKMIREAFSGRADINHQTMHQSAAPNP
jgi:lyso-ornithine lipid O-acyltransferase